MTDRLRVLLVDDIKLFSDIFQEWLHDEDVQVEIAHTGTQAAERLRTAKFDLAFIDYYLPDLTGPEVLTLSRTAGARLPRCYAVTGDGGEKTRQSCLDAGFDDVLIKPLLRSQFVELIDAEKTRLALFG